MLRSALAALAAVVVVSASLIPDDAFARRGGGGGGFRGGGGGFHGGGGRGASTAAADVACMPDASTAAVTGVAHVLHIPSPAARAMAVPDMAVRVIPVAGRPGYGYGGRYPYRGYGAAAAVGAAAAGAAYYGGGYYNSSCYDAYGNWVCPGQYPY